MGPIAGIGDSLLVGTLIPILLGIALGLSSGGSIVGSYFLYRSMELNRNFRNALPLLQRI